MFFMLFIARNKLVEANTTLKYLIFWSDCSQQKGSSAAAEVDFERLKSEQLRSVKMIQQWKNMYENLHQFCVTELMDSSRPETANGDSL